MKDSDEQVEFLFDKTMKTKAGYGKEYQCVVVCCHRKVVAMEFTHGISLALLFCECSPFVLLTICIKVFN